VSVRGLLDDLGTAAAMPRVEIVLSRGRETGPAAIVVARR
jgi:hypothetical protein